MPTLLHVCLLRNYSVITNKSNTYAPVYKTFAIIGSFVSFIFLALLLVPGSPAALTAPSYIALLGWLIIGLIFFVIRYPKLKNMDNDELSRLILNRSENEVDDMIEEPEKKKLNNKRIAQYTFLI